MYSLVKKPSPDMRTQWLPLLMLGVLACIWGSSFILMKRGLAQYNATQVASLRLVFAGISLAPLGWRRWSRIRPRDWRYLLAVALLGNGIPAFLFTTAQTQLSSSLTGALNSLVPLFALLIGVVFFKTTTNRPQLWGVGLGLFGALVLILVGAGNRWTNPNAYALLVVLATLCYATSATLIKMRLQAYPSLTITSASIPLLVLPAAGYLAWVQPLGVPESISAWQALGAIFVLGFGGTALALLLFYHLIAQTSPLFATSVTYLMPIVALLWGWLDGELIATEQLAGMSTILLGVYMIHRGGKS